jgi:hypothetical protein
MHLLYKGIHFCITVALLLCPLSRTTAAHLLQAPQQPWPLLLLLLMMMMILCI